jgi:acetyltransferase-like isoleucine patch superfamily enzyme
MTTPLLHNLEPGPLMEDWFPGIVPENIDTGNNCLIDSSCCFKHYHSRLPVGLKLGNSITLWRTVLSAGERSLIEIGDQSYIGNATLDCNKHIQIGARVYIAGGATVTDSDFRSLNPTQQECGPFESAQAVVIKDDVWIGYNATILAGVTVGEGAVVAPGALVVSDIPAGVAVAGNPARLVTSAGERE